MARLDARDRGGKDILGSEPIIGYESISSSARCDVPHEIPVCTGASEVEPAAMRVKNRRALFRPRRVRPPAGNPSEGIGLEAHVCGSRDSLHHVIERTA